jgi:hypothetical protein
MMKFYTESINVLSYLVLISLIDQGLVKTNDLNKKPYSLRDKSNKILKGINEG